MIEPPLLSPGYRLVEGPPAVPDYLALRERSGLHHAAQIKRQQRYGAAGRQCMSCTTRPAARSEWDAYSVTAGGTSTSSTWLPEHQRRGLGDAILTTLLNAIRQHAPSGGFVNLLADPPGRRLYQRHGFLDTAPGSIGMAQTLE